MINNVVTDQDDPQMRELVSEALFAGIKVGQVSVKDDE
jgi:hypothetical protein